MTSNIERRLRRLEEIAGADATEMFVIHACDDRSEDELRQHFGILDKPGRELLAIHTRIVGRAVRGDTNSELLDYGAVDGRGQYITEPVMESFGPRRGQSRPGSEWVREF